MSFRIVTDTSCNLPSRILEPENITLVPFTFYPQGEEEKATYCLDIDTFDGKAYYDVIRGGKLYNTSQVAPQTFYDHISKFAENGEDVLYVGMSSGISGAYNSSLTAKKMLEEAFPDRKFLMLDTRAASLGEGILVLKAAEYRKQGMTINEAYEKLQKDAECVYQIFTVDSLRHLQRTGRLSGTAMVIGTMLNIKPILKGNPLGQIVNIEKALGNRKAIKAMADRYHALVKHPETQTVCIAHADNEADTAKLIDLINEKNPPKEILSICYEPVTGAHVGPGTVALFFMGDENVRNR